MPRNLLSTKLPALCPIGKSITDNYGLALPPDFNGELILTLDIYDPQLANAIKNERRESGDCVDDNFD